MESFEKPTFNGRIYNNPRSFVNWKGLPGWRAVARWRFRETDASSVPNNATLDETLPVQRPDFNTRGNKLAATWLGHATVLVQMDRIAFITDPVWSQRASPLQCFGPQRYRPPPVAIDDLPNLQFGVISHNHYDHLDASTVRRLSTRFPDMEWFVPAGLGPWMRRHVNNNLIHELSWGEHTTLALNEGKYQVWCIPAQHWSLRTPFDRNRSLWCGWAIIGPERKFYYSGDTGFCDTEFKKLGTNLGPFDLAAIPIGCYAPRFIMQSQHIDPEEVVQIHKLIRSVKTMGIHWGTYKMGSYEPYLEPRSKLREAVEAAGLNSADVFTVNHGETWIEDPTAVRTSHTGSEYSQSSASSQ